MPTFYCNCNPHVQLKHGCIVFFYNLFLACSSTYWRQLLVQLVCPL